MKSSSSTKPGEATTGARERLLKIAGPLFAKHGRDGLSVRQITAAAGVNLAAVNYHFGSKDGLFHAVCLERVRSMNALRLATLEAAQKLTAPAAPTVEQVFEAYVRPLVEHLLQASDPSSLLMTRMIMNEFGDANSQFVKLMHDEIQPFIKCFVVALATALEQSLHASSSTATQKKLPDGAIEAISWGLLFNTGAMLHTTMCSAKFSLFFPDIKDSPRHEKIIEHIVSYSTAGLHALVTAKK